VNIWALLKTGAARQLHFARAPDKTVPEGALVGAVAARIIRPG
jgi:hypothetical protein